MNKLHPLTEYVDRLYAAALKKTGDSFAAQDLAQETLLAAARSLAAGREPENLWAWLCRVLSNKYYDSLREKYNRPWVSFESLSPDFPDREPEDDGTAELLQAVRRELGYLSRIHREVMVRFYLRGESVEKIAQDLGIPAGTVKSRLSAGRRRIREGVNRMENYNKQSYAPDRLFLSCSGGVGYHGEPFSLVPHDDVLAQSVLLAAYEKPLTESEIAKALGVPGTFVEPVVQRLVNGELMRRTDGGRVYTDFILYTEKDRKATFPQQLAVARDHFALFWEPVEQALAALRGQDYYQRQSPAARLKLELHFAIRLLMNALVDVRDEVTGSMPYEEYPYRKDGGRWFAMASVYPPDYSFEADGGYWKYSISGEAGTELKNFRDAGYLALFKYDTALGRYPNEYFKAEYVRWLYELWQQIPPEASAAGERVFQAAEGLLESGVLRRKDGALALDIPVLTRAEYRGEGALASQHQAALYRRIREVLLPVFENGYVRLPAHLHSVPKWQTYMHCGDSVPMAVIHNAVEKGRFLAGHGGALPACLLVYDPA